MRIRLLGALLACMIAAALATGATGSSKRPLVIQFEKDCPEWTCWETPGSLVDVSATITPVYDGFEAPLFHYTSVETFTSSKGSVTVSLAGVLDTEAEPEETVLKGYVIRGYGTGRTSQERPSARRPTACSWTGRSSRPGDDHPSR